MDIVRRARLLEDGNVDEAVATERLTFIWVIRDASERFQSSFQSTPVVFSETNVTLRRTHKIKSSGSHHI